MKIEVKFLILWKYNKILIKLEPYPEDKVKNSSKLIFFNKTTKSLEKMNKRLNTSPKKFFKWPVSTERI